MDGSKICDLKLPKDWKGFEALVLGRQRLSSGLMGPVKLVWQTYCIELSTQYGFETLGHNSTYGSLTLGSDPLRAKLEPEADAPYFGLNGDQVNKLWRLVCEASDALRSLNVLKWKCDRINGTDYLLFPEGTAEQIQALKNRVMLYSYLEAKKILDAWDKNLAAMATDIALTHRQARQKEIRVLKLRLAQLESEEKAGA